jgi:CheY-like chemotaxis protein
VEATRPLFEARRHAVELHHVDAAHAILGDPVRLAQVVENILINAAKYTPNGGRIDVSATVDGGGITIAVQDTGVGIAPEMLGRVFDLFSQADTSLDRAEGGLGIGLTLVDRLTRMHGGEARAFSDGIGHGSRFTVRLPLIEADVTASARADSAPPVQRRRVLVVDDNRDSAEMLQELITMAGHTVHIVHDGFEAVVVAREFLPDVVLLDIGLPGKDGYQVINELRTVPELAATAIIATTGYGRAEDRARCLEAGFDDHITKPIDPAQLEGVLGAQAPAVTPQG